MKLRSARCSLCPRVIEPIPYIRRLMRETGSATVRELHLCPGCGAVVCSRHRGQPIFQHKPSDHRSAREKKARR
jgi:hypothetical protein